MTQNKIIAELHQKAWSKGKRSFVLREDGTVEAMYRQGFRHTSFALNARLLDPTPLRQRHKAVAMMVGASIFGAFDLTFFVGAVGMTASDDRWAFLMAGALFMLPVLLCLWEYLKQSFQAVIFFSPFSQNTLVLMDGSPRREECERFIKELSDTIFRLRQKWDAMHPGEVMDRIKELAQMRDSDILSEQEFQKLKQELVAGQKVEPSIGFK